MSAPELLLDVRELRAGYGEVEVVHGIDLRVHAGEVVALLGPNGAGKTTTLRTVSALLPLLGGEIDVLSVSLRPGVRRGRGVGVHGFELHWGELLRSRSRSRCSTGGCRKLPTSPPLRTISRISDDDT